MPEISVIIPLYNKVATIGRAIDSALAQTGVQPEIVVVDDGSDDGSEAVVRRYGQRVRYLRQANAGPAAARNRAAEASRGRVLAFLDADDEFLPGALAQHLRCRQACSRAGLTLAPFRVLVDGRPYMDERIHDRPGQWHRRDGFHFVDGFHAELVRGVVSGSIAVDRLLFETAGQFDADLHCWEISDLLLRVHLASPCVGVLPDHGVVIHGNLHDGQFARSRGDSATRTRRAHNLIDAVPRIPGAQRPAILRHVLGSLRELLSAGDVREFRQLAARLEPDWCADRELRLLRRLGRLPEPLVLLARHSMRLAAR